MGDLRSIWPVFINRSKVIRPSVDQFILRPKLSKTRKILIIPHWSWFKILQVINVSTKIRKTATADNIAN